MQQRQLPFLIFILCAVPLWNGCMLDESCTADPIVPANVTAVAGNGSVTVSWELSPPAGTNYLASEVRYSANTSAGADCSAEELGAGCVLGCQFSHPTDMPLMPSCSISGLTNGTAYTCTIVTKTLVSNPSCTAGHAHAAISATPLAN